MLDLYFPQFPWTVVLRVIAVNTVIPLEEDVCGGRKHIDEVVFGVSQSNYPRTLTINVPGKLWKKFNVDWRTDPWGKEGLTFGEDRSWGLSVYDFNLEQRTQLNFSKRDKVTTVEEPA